MKVYLYETDVFRIKLMTQNEAENWFGYTLEDMNAEISPELIERYKTIENQYQLIQKELRDALKKEI